MGKWVVGALFALSALGCAGRSERRQPSTEGAAGAADVELGTASCGQLGRALSFDSAPRFREALLGTWLFCSGGSLFENKHDALELAADGTVAFLRYDSEVLVRQPSPYGDGRWSLIDTGAVERTETFQVDFAMPFGTAANVLSLQDRPSALHLTSMGTRAEYVRGPD